MNGMAGGVDSRSRHPGVVEAALEVAITGAVVGARVFLPTAPLGLVVVANPSGIARLGWRERALAQALAGADLLTLLVDLLTDEEDDVSGGAHDDVPLQAARLLDVVRWLKRQPQAVGLDVGVMGSGTAAVATVLATAIEPGLGAVVCRGGRADHAGASLLLTDTPTLFLVMGEDAVELAAAKAACGRSARRALRVVPLFETEDGFERTVSLGRSWLMKWLRPPSSFLEARP
jgi:putative phosphoribosyl transferase